MSEVTSCFLFVLVTLCLDELTNGASSAASTQKHKRWNRFLLAGCSSTAIYFSLLQLERLIIYSLPASSTEMQICSVHRDMQELKLADSSLGKCDALNYFEAGDRAHWCPHV